MKKKLVTPLLFMFTLLVIVSCSQNKPQIGNSDGVKIIGTVTYDRVPMKTDAYGSVQLDYNNIHKVSGKHLWIKALDENGQLLSKTTTDAQGKYLLFVPKNTNVKIRVYARMFKEKKWDVAVVDNTNQKAMYVIEGGLYNSGTQATQRDLHASSGWNGYSYATPRDAAPFAILDSINTIMQKVVSANSSVTFPQLLVNWSPNNVAAGGDPSLGQIVTSNYDGKSNLWILGDANSDTDEYDDHIIIHEWAHFFEDKFSRSDSIGGPHSSGDALDIRVAFGEGFGNAMSAIATDNPVYFDTSGPQQSTGWAMNIESAPAQNPGWFSEASIQRILYDLYDSNNDGMDNLSLGFAPIYNVMVTKERNSKAFTSIFSFIHALKSDNANYASQIDQVVATEQISPIQDAYGQYRSNSAQGTYNTPIYRNLKVGQGVTQCNQNNFGVYNKLGNRTFLKVNIPQSGLYKFDARPYANANGDPDIVLYKAQYPYKSMAMSPLEGVNNDSLTINLAQGEYMLEVYDASFNNSCFTIKLAQESNMLKQSISKGKLGTPRKPKILPQY